MATHSNILAWEISWMEEPGRQQNPWGCKESDITERLNNNKYLNKAWELIKVLNGKEKGGKEEGRKQGRMKEGRKGRFDFCCHHHHYSE